jgi:DNA-binding transcriptional MerR regulator
VDKGPEAFRTISEVAAELDLPQHVLRFWETKFAQVKPIKRAGGRRYYRPGDVELLRGIRSLLYGEGYTIRGVQRILREQGARKVIGLSRGEPLTDIPADDPQPHEPRFEFEDDEDDAPPVRPGRAVLAARAVDAAEEAEAEDGDEEDEPVARPRRPAPEAGRPVSPPAPRRELSVGDPDLGEPLPRDIRPDDDEGGHRSSALRFFDRLRGDVGRGDGALSRDEIRSLQATLFELLECKRLLDQAR